MFRVFRVGHEDEFVLADACADVIGIVERVVREGDVEQRAPQLVEERARMPALYPHGDVGMTLREDAETAAKVHVVIGVRAPQDEIP